MTLWLVPPLLLSGITGAALVHLLGGRGSRWLLIVIGLPLGLAVSSLLFMLAPPTWVAHRAALLMADSLLALMALAAARQWGPRVSASWSSSPPAASPGPASGSASASDGGEKPLPVQSTSTRGASAAGIAILALTVLLIILAAVNLVGFCLRKPHGWFDAWGIWNLKALFLYRGGREHWSRFLTDFEGWSHADYPLLISASVARLWAYLGGESNAAPIALVCVFAGATLVLLPVLLWRRGVHLAALAVAGLASSELFLSTASYQCADVPLGFYMLAALAVLVAAARRQCHPALAGLLIGCVMWTKNEGLLFALLCGLAVLAALACRRWFTLRDLAALALGMAPFALAAGIVKLSANTGNDVVGAQPMSVMLQRLADPARHHLILQYAGNLAWKLADPWLLGPMLALLLIGGWTRDRAQRAAALVVLVIVALMALGYYTVYLITPHELNWHVSSSIDRLVVQLLPSLILGVCWLAAGAAGSGRPGGPQPQT